MYQAIEWLCLPLLGLGWLVVTLMGAAILCRLDDKHDGRTGWYLSGWVIWQAAWTWIPAAYLFRVVSHVQ